jgi:hypothetical protein
MNSKFLLAVFPEVEILLSRLLRKQPVADWWLTLQLHILWFLVRISLEPDYINISRDLSQHFQTMT